jgi:gliding motility-associated-like protein
MYCLSSQLNAQALPPLQPEQDACGALQLCGTFYTPYSYSGFGFIQELSQFGPSGGCFTESNSVWFKLVVATAGNIVFAITPVDPTNDYDFIVHDITNDTCTNLTAANRIRCNGNNNFTGSNPGGIVGLNMTSTLTYVAAGTFGSSYLQYIAASPGDVYLIMIDNFSASASGFTLDFTGTTATFVGSALPAYADYDTTCNNSMGMTIHMNGNVKCSSIAADGSDFQIVPNVSTVTSATGTGCSGGNGYTDEIVLTFFPPLPTGSYILTPKNGTDGNTLLNLCDNPQPFTDSMHFEGITPVDVDLGPDLVVCAGGTLQLNTIITGGGTNNQVRWTPGTYLSDSTITNPTVTPGTDITYVVTITPNGPLDCHKTDTINISTLKGFTIFNHDSTICKGQSVVFNVSGDPGYTYLWSPATFLANPNSPSTVTTPDSTITYGLTASFPGCPDSSKFITITVEPVPTVFAGADQTLCYGDTLRMAPVITPANFSGYQYSWTPAGAFDAPNKATPLYTAFTTTTVTLTVKTPQNCTNSDSRLLKVQPQHFITVSQDTGVCPRDTAQIHVTGAASYTWVPDQNISDTNSANPNVYPVTITTYTVYASDAIGCKDTGEVTVRVFPGASLSLPDSVTIFPGESYQMQPDGNGLYFSWFPPLGLTAANIANPVAMPDVNTRYFVQAVTETGCKANDSIDVFVSYESFIDMPNAFSPGSDPNAVLNVATRGLVKLKTFKIFNRWGNKLFESTNVTEGWNGQYNGKPQSMGVYVYIVEAVTPTGRTFYKQGNVTLIR